MKPLVLISPWFGPWPSWINFFLESCRYNTEVDWLIPTDQRPPENRPPNVQFRETTFDDYLQSYGKFLKLDLSNVSSYKMCDLRPSLGAYHSREIRSYYAWGYCDLDLIFGDIRHFYNDDVLRRYDAISASTTIMTGHLAVFRNNLMMRNAFRLIPRWRSRFRSERYWNVDEKAFGKLLNPKSERWPRRAIRRALGLSVLFQERYSTVGSRMTWDDGKASPQVWTWKRGKLSHERQPGGESLYLHFMHWKWDRYRHDQTPAPWQRLQSIVNCDWREAAEKGFVISPEGFHLICIASPAEKLPSDHH